MLTTNHTLTPDRSGYPPLLRHAKMLADPLYVSGSLDFLACPCVSIIGSRKMSQYGRAVVAMLVPPLVRAGVAIVSGLAYGIDSFAHKVALAEGGKCVAVLGSGLQSVYPASHQGLAEEIVASGGCVMSQYGGEVGPQKSHFPERNQVVASLSLATVIVEAGARSGTLITARAALDAGREVCVVPGDITREGSAGVLSLLRQGARPVGEAGDILEAIGLDPHPKPRRPALTGSEADLYDLVSCGHGTIDELVRMTGMTVSELQGMLTLLELSGHLATQGTTWHPTSLS